MAEAEAAEEQFPQVIADVQPEGVEAMNVELPPAAAAVENHQQPEGELEVILDFALDTYIRAFMWSLS